MSYPLIVIEVHSGVAECVKKPQGVRVVIKDYDNEGRSNACTATEWKEGEELTGE